MCDRLVLLNFDRLIILKVTLILKELKKDMNHYYS